MCDGYKTQNCNGVRHELNFEQVTRTGQSVLVLSDLDLSVILASWYLTGGNGRYTAARATRCQDEEQESSPGARLPGLACLFPC